MSTNTGSDSAQPLSYEIIIASTPEERQQCYDVRIEVFHHEQKFPLETEIDEMEDKATHFLLRLTPSLTPVGTVRAFKMPGKDYYKLTRLAVLQDYRRHRLGYALVQRMHDWVRQDHLDRQLQLQLQGDRDTVIPIPIPNGTGEGKGKVNGRDAAPAGLVEIVLHSQIPAKAFYAKFGYEPEGPEFDEDGDPHQKMVLHMPLRPSSIATIAE